MFASPKTKYSIEEYIELIKNSEGRFEYFDGELFEMTGGKIDHSRISSNVIHYLRNHLKGSNCEVFGEVAVKVPAAWPFRFPDVSVVCGATIIEDFQGIEMLINPLLIVEVLSPSTATYVLKDKFLAYQSIDSFTEYLVILQDRAHIIQHIKQPDGLWLRRDVADPNAVINLGSISVTLTLQEVYERVEFPATPTIPIIIDGKK